MSQKFEFCVIGAGLFGSASAKYVSAHGSTILIGVSEASRIETQRFGAWHDEGRITTPWMSQTAWHILAKQSIGRYRSIESQSGIQFFTEIGFLRVFLNSIEKDEDSENIKAFAKKLISDGFDIKEISNECPEESLGFLQFPLGYSGFYQPKRAGHLSPRQLILAQHKIAIENGCNIVDGQVVDVDRVDEGFKVTYELPHNKSTQTIIAKKLIIAPGAYGNLNSWMKKLYSSDHKDDELDLTLATQTVAYLELDESEALRLQNMPSLCTEYEFGSLDGTYILPPIRYPDGKYYLKLGHGDNFEKYLHTEEEVKDWYNTLEGVPEAVSALADFVQSSLIPDIKVIGVHGGCCVTSNTRTKKAPYIDKLSNGVYLVAGGCGYGAKSSDEIGRVGATFAALGEWDSEVPKELCQIEWR